MRVVQARADSLQLYPDDEADLDTLRVLLESRKGKLILTGQTQDNKPRSMGVIVWPEAV